MEYLVNDIVSKSLQEAKDKVINYISLEITLGDQNPSGRQQHFKELIFDLKKKASNDLLGRLWANDGFPEVTRDQVKGALIHFGNMYQKRQVEDRKFYRDSPRTLQEELDDLASLLHKCSFEFWIYYLKIKALEKSLEPGKKDVPDNFSLELAFDGHTGQKNKNKENYLRIMDELVQKGYCFKKTYHATSELNKKQIVSLIKYIGVNYLRKFSNEEVRTIALNTFNVDVSEDTVKKNHPSKPFSVVKLTF